ncbi:hypothetical protein [Chryseobacterium bernardetii]|uniref:hypothetical protein n=1 Tax=Chryseobacterium bernardetii TaxID=1241978 RepID=UPI0030191BE3
MSGYILKKNNESKPLNILENFIKIAYTIDCIFIYNNNKYISEKDKYDYLSVNFADDFNQISEDNERQFQFYLYINRLQNIEIYHEIFYKVGYIELIDDDNTKLIFEFVYEYLKLNPEEYFWVEWGYLYKWEDMQKLKSIPFDKDWCFKIPPN